MINIKSYITVSPRIVRSHTRALITVSAKFDFISFEGEYEIAVLPKYYYESGDRVAEYSVFYANAEGGEIKFEYAFAREQEYCLKINKRGECGGHDSSIELSLYALDEDLFGLYETYEKSGLKNPGVVIDCNHANSGKKYLEQPRIAKEVLHSCRYSKEVGSLVKGLMIESYIEDGCQTISDHDVYGKSITDPCLGWEKTERLIYELADVL